MLPIGTQTMVGDSQGMGLYFRYDDNNNLLKPLMVPCALCWDPSYQRTANLQFVKCTNHAHRKIPSNLEGVLLAVRINDMWYLAVGYEKGVACQLRIKHGGIPEWLSETGQGLLLLPSGNERFLWRNGYSANQFQMADEYCALSLISGTMEGVIPPIATPPNPVDRRIQMGPYPHCLPKFHWGVFTKKYVRKSSDRGYKLTPSYIKPSKKEQHQFQRFLKVTKTSTKISLVEDCPPYLRHFGVPLLSSTVRDGSSMDFAMLSFDQHERFSASLQGANSFKSPSSASHHAALFGTIVRYRICSFDHKAKSFFMRDGAGHVALFLSGVYTHQCHRHFQPKELNDFFALALQVTPPTARKTTHHGGSQMFGPQHSSTLARCSPIQGPPTVLKTWYGSRTVFSQSKRCGDVLENVSSSKMAERLATATSNGIAKEIAYPYVRGHSVGRYGPCAIHIFTQQFFYNSAHKDPDGHILEYQQEIQSRIQELEGIIAKKNPSEKESQYLQWMLEGHRVSDSAPSTCTWSIDSNDDNWVVHVYFLFPASRIALRLEDKCGLFWHPAKLVHCTAINVATNKATGETVFLGVAGGNAPVNVRAWGGGGPPKDRDSVSKRTRSATRQAKRRSGKRQKSSR